MPQTVFSLEIRSGRADKTVAFGIALRAGAVIAVVVIAVVVMAVVVIAVIVIGVGIGPAEWRGRNRARGVDRARRDAGRRSHGPADDIARPEARTRFAWTIIA